MLRVAAAVAEEKEIKSSVKKTHLTLKSSGNAVITKRTH